MQVTETASDGLKREFQVVVPAADLVAKADERLNELKGQVRLNGFRQGKVPVSHLKRLYGRSAMAEAIENAVREANSKIVTERGFKLVRDPQVTLPTEESAVEQVIDGKSDLAYTVAIEIMPPIEIANFKGIKLEKVIAEVTDAEVDEAVKRLADANRPFVAKAEGAKAESGDRVTIDFTGKVDNQPFEGGTGGDVVVQIGSGTFIPGFEDQLVGIAAGETRTVNVTFPESYPAEKLAGKKAEFEVVAKSMEAPTEVAIDDEFANVWKTIMDDLQSRNRTFADEDTTEEKAREEYRGIAERRVRLGLVIAEIGERNSIKVSDDEVSRGVMERARQVPGREQEVWNFYSNNPDALASVRAPIFEDKVIDYILELAKITDKTVSREELYKEEEA